MSYQVDVQIEIPKGSRVKYEYNHKTHQLIVDRFVRTPVDYFFNYGYVPNTLSGDGDPLDAVILCQEVLCPRAFISCKILGVLDTEDEKGRDEKLILVPSDHISYNTHHIKNIGDIEQSTLDRVRFFFENYKTLEPNKWVNVIGFGDREAAMKVYQESCDRSQKFDKVHPHAH